MHRNRGLLVNTRQELSAAGPLDSVRWVLSGTRRHGDLRRQALVHKRGARVCVICEERPGVCARAGPLYPSHPHPSPVHVHKPQRSAIYLHGTYTHTHTPPPPSIIRNTTGPLWRLLKPQSVTLTASWAAATLFMVSWGTGAQAWRLVSRWWCHSRLFWCCSRAVVLNSELQNKETETLRDDRSPADLLVTEVEVCSLDVLQSRAGRRRTHPFPSVGKVGAAFLLLVSRTNVLHPGIEQRHASTLWTTANVFGG